MKGNKVTCPRCSRVVGEHGRSSAGIPALHLCPHGWRCDEGDVPCCDPPSEPCTFTPVDPVAERTREIEAWIRSEASGPVGDLLAQELREKYPEAFT